MSRAVGSIDLPGQKVNGDKLKAAKCMSVSLQGEMLVVAERNRTVPAKFVGSLRGDVTEFSDGSRMRMRRYLRTAKANYTTFITLTYPSCFPSNGRVVKEHLRRFNQEVARHLHRRDDDRKLSLFWFLEFQERGAPHFHIFSTHDIPKKWLSETWFRIVGTEDERHLRAGTNVQAIRGGRAASIGYAMKYAGKSNQKRPPPEYQNVGRFWGISGRRATSEAATMVSELSREQPAVEQAFVRLMNEIREASIKEDTKTLVKKEGVRVYIIKNAEMRERIERRIYLLNARIELAGHRHSMFDPLDGAELQDYCEESGVFINVKRDVTGIA